MDNRNPKITFIGAGSTVFMKNLIGDVLQREALSAAQVTLMDIDETRLNQSAVVAERMISTLGVDASVTTHMNQRQALQNADFVIVAFQIGGYEPCTVTDFDIPKKYGLRQTIADTLGIGGIMRGLRTVPHLWSVCEDMMEVCPDALLLQYVNPMAINTWAIAEKYPEINQVGLCHSVQGTAEQLATDLDINVKDIRYECAGINHIAFFLKLEEQLKDGNWRDLYPELKQGYLQGRYPKAESQYNDRCPNTVRYEMTMRLGYFVTESSEHFAEYVPWFIKEGREDLIKKFGIPLDEYPMRCIEQVAEWEDQYKTLQNEQTVELEQTHEYASEIIHSMWTGIPSVIHGNVANTDLISNLPRGCAVEVACLVDGNGVQPTRVGKIPPQLAAVMQSNVSVQQLVVEALISEDIHHIYHAAMMDPHTAAELDIEQIWNMTTELLQTHNEWLPEWARKSLPNLPKTA